MRPAACDLIAYLSIHVFRMPLLRFDNIHLAFGHRALLDGVDLEIHGRERVCLVGRNGEGKSSLLKLIDGQIEPDDGDTWRRPGIRIAMLNQEVESDLRGSVFDVVASGLPRLGKIGLGLFVDSREAGAASGNDTRPGTQSSLVGVATRARSRRRLANPAKGRDGDFETRSGMGKAAWILALVDGAGE